MNKYKVELSYKFLVFFQVTFSANRGKYPTHIVFRVNIHENIQPHLFLAQTENSK